MKRIISLFLTVVFVLSLASVFNVSASSSQTDFTNLYDASKVVCGTLPSTATGAPSYNANYFATPAISVSAGDKIYFGPCFPEQGYYLTSYTSSGSVKETQIKHSNANVSVHAKFDNNTEILCWTVPDGVASFRMATSQMFYDSTLITKNQPYDKNAYFSYCDSKNINVDYLRVTESKEELVNLFPKSDKTFDGRVDGKGAEIAADAYRTSDFIPVKEGDVLYFAAAVFSQGYHLALFDSNKKAITTVNSKFMVHYEDLGRGYETFAYRFRPGTSYVRVVAATGVYDDSIELVTLNQPFSGDQYRKMFNITLSDTPADPQSPLNGLKALFCGDSISYGAHDTLSYKRIGKAWAGRITSQTGLISTNASVSGAKASYISGDDTAKWLYNQLEANKNGSFDIVVMHGGVNDARHNRSIGKISDSDNDSEYNLTTYIGGLQKLFVNAKKYFPNAKLFFISNFHLDGHSTGNAKNMAPYFDMAEQLCEKYGIQFIDLYNNKELNDKLETTTTKYLPDTLHPNAAGYDIITPYIIEALEKGLASSSESGSESVSESEPAASDSEPAGSVTEDMTVGHGTSQSTEKPEEPSKGCASVISGAGTLSVILLAAWISLKKKR